MMDTKAAIVAAARDLFLESGYPGMTMRAVAKRVGVSATAIYRHFRDKDALLAAVVDEGRELLGAYLFQALEGRTPQERLRKTGLQYLEFAFDQPGYFEVFFLSWGRLDPVVHGGADAAGPPPTFQFLIDRVREAAAVGVVDIEPDDGQAVMAVAVHLWAHVHGLAALWIRGGAKDFMPPEAWRALCHQSVDRLLLGLRAEGGSGIDDGS